MSRFLKIQALASRAFSLFGRTGRQAAAAKKQRAAFYREAWKEAADILGAEAEKLDEDTFHIRGARASARVCLNYTPLDDPVSLRIAGNKPIVHRLLQAQQIPVPAYRAFDLKHHAPALEFLRHHGTCVVKPASGTGGGQGVTTGVETPRDLRRAVVCAAGYGSDLIIEQQVPGRNFRLLFLDGQLLDAIERRPPSVTGDGHSSVGRLLDRMNRERVLSGADVAQSIVRRDQDMRRTLASQGLSFATVPACGEMVRLKTVINDNAAEDNDRITDLLHDEIVAASRAAVSTVGLRLAGVDVVTPDPEKNLDTVGGVVLEVNSTPGLYFHYAGAQRRCRVAVPILAACLGCRVDASRWNAGAALHDHPVTAIGTDSRL